MDECILILAAGETLAVLFYHWLRPVLVLSVFGLALALRHRDNKGEPLVAVLHMSWLFWLCWSSALGTLAVPDQGPAALHSIASACLGISVAINAGSEFKGPELTPRAGLTCGLVLLLGMLPMNPAPLVDGHDMLVQTAIHIGVPYLLQHVRQRENRGASAQYLFASSFWLITVPLFPGALLAGGFGVWLVGRLVAAAGNSNKRTELPQLELPMPQYRPYAVPAELRRPGALTKPQKVERFDDAFRPRAAPAQPEPLATPTELPFEQLHLPDA